MNIVCLFPGYGYTCDKPLLYYTAKMFSHMGWKVLRVSYDGLPSDVKAAPDRMMKCAEIALESAERQLEGMDWDLYDRILFVSKSIGTVVATAYAGRHRVPCRHVLFTPLEATFSNGVRQGIVFHGTADVWVDIGVIREACRENELPLYITENGNHSLETGDIPADLETVRRTVETVREYVERRD